ncbi:MAG: hypothetical protein Q4B40_02580 [Clostridia bacterium]|nr:hypothetical protein [Clostridia bacterium]
MKIECPKFFLAANSAEGFVSHFGDSFNAHDGWRAYLIKGGPGSGKSSFMKYIAVKAVDCGYTVELCPCSSDPDSLDGVIIKDIKTVLLDATSPHALEPKYPAACEQVINLGEFWNGEKLHKNAQKIIEVTDQNKKLHKTASAYISAAGELMLDNFKLSEQATNLKKAQHFAQKTAARLIPKSNKNSYEWVRFIGGITPAGVVAFSGTVEKHYKNIVVIEDKNGAVANQMMQAVRKYALSRGHEIITLKNPFLPSLIIDHILIPELSTAFVREYEYMRFDEHHRRIHSRRFENVNMLRAVRTRITFNRRVSRELLIGAATALSNAKAVHDQMESYYIDAMDFRSVTQYAQKIAGEIFK